MAAAKFPAKQRRKSFPTITKQHATIFLEKELGRCDEIPGKATTEIVSDNYKATSYDHLLKEFGRRNSSQSNNEKCFRQ